MNLEEKRQEFVALLSDFLNDAVSVDVLQEFVWDVINYFSTTPKRDLPPSAEFEKTFWYVIWQVQHLATEDHLSDGSAFPELKEALEYLQGGKDLPDEYVGRRP